MTTVPRLRSNFASNLRGPTGGAVIQPRRLNRPIRFFVFADSVILIARSNAMCPFIAVAIVRPMNLRILDHFFLRASALESSSLGLGVCDMRAEEGSSLFLPEVILPKGLRIGHNGSLLCEVGGGGNGVELISPRRRRARVSWAFVGTPFRSVLVSS